MNGVSLYLGDCGRAGRERYHDEARTSIGEGVERKIEPAVAVDWVFLLLLGAELMDGRLRLGSMDLEVSGAAHY